jgi:hypothetical protein
MIIKKYGIELHRLKEDNVEMLRQKRNEKSIREKMFYQEEISFDEQLKWFKSINNIYNYYFVIHYKDEQIGLIHGKVLSYEARIAEGGIFLWNENYHNSVIPILSSVCMADITFLIMQMNKTLAEVRSDNNVALDYNLKLGYEIKEELKVEGKIKLELTKESYFKKAFELRKAVKKIAKDKHDVSWDDITIPMNDPNKLYEGLPEYLQSNFDKIRSNA